MPSDVVLGKVAHAVELHREGSTVAAVPWVNFDVFDTGPFVGVEIGGCRRGVQAHRHVEWIPTAARGNPSLPELFD